jgi:hypothetical protein
MPAIRTSALKLAPIASCSPPIFMKPLVFVLNTPAYAVHQIAGDLKDEEKIVFIKRLMEEGLIVRKEAEKKLPYLDQNRNHGDD